jgi:GTP diphosphokinase
MKINKKNTDEIIDFYKNDENFKYELNGFKQQVENFFLNWPKFIVNDKSVVHSVKSRIKNVEHLRDKLQRKMEAGRKITLENFRNEVTDLIGIRVLYLYPAQFEIIHNEIIKRTVGKNEWKFMEDPKAYTWDPEAAETYKGLGIKPEIKETFYTSVHYVIRPNNQNNQSICCEIQVRTLFEEIWGEIDHTINYPHSTDIVACKEQLKVLAKLISSGTRLSDSIFRCYNEYNKSGK